MTPIPARTSVVPLAWMAVLYAALALLLTFPLVRHLSTALPHDNLDPGFNAWLLWWDAHRVPFSTAWWNAPFFYPLAGAVALSEHVVGISLVTTPLFWLGATPALAHNLALLLSFVLSAFCAALLVRRLTGRCDAALLAGLAFGFAPYRISQISHLQVLVSWWMPLALVALHEYVDRGRSRWLALFGASWLLQALSNGYYLFFFSVLLPLWLVWFVPLRERKKWAAILAAWALAAAPLVPVLLTYADVQRRQGLTRNLGEIATFGARVNAAVFASPLLAIWGRWLPGGPGESQLFPGITLALLLAIGAIATWRIGVREMSAAWRWIRRTLFFSSAALALVAAGSLVGPWRLDAGPLVISIGRLDRPLGLAFVLAGAALLTSPRLRAAFARRSVLAFYAVAAGVMGVLSLGPAPQLGDTPLWYKAPYAWLLQLPGFGGLRVPARFAMPALLCMAVVAAVVFARLVARRNRWRPALVALVALGLIADTWTISMPLAAATPPLALPAAVPPDAVVLELPLGDIATDIEAMGHARGHEHPLVNGYSGYTPAHSLTLAFGLLWGDHDVLRALAGWAPVAVRVARDRDPDGHWRAFMREQPDTRLIASDGSRDVYLVSKSPASSPRQVGSALPVQAAAATVNGEAASRAIDGRRDTRWQGAWLDAGHETFTLDLGAPRSIGGVSLAQQGGPGDFPRYLSIEVGDGDGAWQVAWRGLAAGRYFNETVLHPTAQSVRFEFAPLTGRYVQLRVGGDVVHPWTWSIAEVTVHAPAR